MKIEDLYEAPMNIPDLDWHDLNNDEKNYEHFIKYNKKPYARNDKILKLTEYASIYKFKSEYFCLDTNEQRITYYMKYQVSNNGILKQYVWQSLVWISPAAHLTYLKDIPSKVFFEHLLQRFHTIVTDSEQTWHGRRFWEYRIAEAFSKGLNVYFFNFENRLLKKLNSFKDLEKFQEQYDIWGNTNRHTMKRMVISTLELK